MMEDRHQAPWGDWGRVIDAWLGRCAADTPRASPWQLGSAICNNCYNSYLPIMLRSEFQMQEDVQRRSNELMPDGAARGKDSSRGPKGARMTSGNFKIRTSWRCQDPKGGSRVESNSIIIPLKLQLGETLHKAVLYYKSNLLVCFLPCSNNSPEICFSCDTVVCWEQKPPYSIELFAC